jgi:tetratricopeptide (TPR) repeat protein
MVARLDVVRDPEEVAADLIELWPSLETSLRSLIGGSALAGQALIREVRQRELLSLDQAHALLELLAVYEKVQHTEYRPTDADIATAHEAYSALEAALSAGPADGLSPASYGPPPRSSSVPEAAEPAVPPPDVTGKSGRGSVTRVAILAGIIVFLAALGTYLYSIRHGVQGKIRAGIEAYQKGESVAARVMFAQVAREHPELVLPHLYLARIARDEDDFGTAGTELAKAGQLAPTDPVVQRELGAFFLARGEQYLSIGRADLARTDFNAARNRYVSALQINAQDSTARGYLGCALIELGRVDEGKRWLARAGPGGWSACAPSEPASNPPPHS